MYRTFSHCDRDVAMYCGRVQGAVNCRSPSLGKVTYLMAMRRSAVEHYHGEISMEIRDMAAGSNILSAANISKSHNPDTCNYPCTITVLIVLNATQQTICVIASGGLCVYCFKVGGA